METFEAQVFMTVLWSLIVVIGGCMFIALLLIMDYKKFDFSKGCPPCNGNCNQGRDCPGRK